MWIYWVWGLWGGGMLTFIPHIRHATLLHVLLHFHTYVMLPCCTFFCPSTHTSCYAAPRSLALPHIRLATCCTFFCPPTHTSCYLAALSFAVSHIPHAMLLHVLLRFHTYVMLRARTACSADGCKAWKEPPNNKCQKHATNGKTLPTTEVSL